MKKYATTGGWGFADFKDGKPGDEALHKTCFPCHAPAKDRDYVFARYAPTVPLVLGSDTPAGDGFGNPPGLNGRLEMQNWADSGALLFLLLRAATIDNASALGLAAEVGTIEVGKRADMVLLKENPLASVAAYDSIEAVFLGGQPIPRKALRGQQ